MHSKRRRRDGLLEVAVDLVESLHMETKEVVYYSFNYGELYEEVISI